ncbi:glutamyl-Q tRNA(Asp) synthetase [Roseibium hamelinense]|uniref:Glutamyl-Q tRNA(Asp) synthetase n=1 Tax=Roseibium hamelinense TaxID=150831 RepID=A0A562SKQ1_9HYPH|nr:tRNA glutamyl-Q(34) synthetase GluQRS [Roseibium hamelinense]MTI43420.1 tRNA glutamyl-Q(34) synthetase GluQRS [Roseibium hamelinense]TWI81877.1 glutamyl-Q tRNA(Asp) synthetase [Roseibium hamelinense]
MSIPVFRFAPSPNGHLHIGHALSALLNYEAARQMGGRFLLRIEDIDQTRCTPELEADMLEDLEWLGLEWETPVLRQSDRFDAYRAGLQKLSAFGILYRSVLTRSEIKQFVADCVEEGNDWPKDPDGVPVSPNDGMVLSDDERIERLSSGASYAVRVDMVRAMRYLKSSLTWQEAGSSLDALAEAPHPVSCDPSQWGDVVLARKETPTSYHLSVVLDDAYQGVTDILRGKDLYHATSLHRLLQQFLGLPSPVYRHHDLVLGEDGKKLSKSTRSTSLRSLREAGSTPADIRQLVGL